jgi:small-conductance mechanosensitive channel
MAIPWLLALKVIPWGDVIEHAPKVLNAARKLMDRQRTEPAPAVSTTATADWVGEAQPSLGELKNRLIAAQVQLDRQADTQEQLAQTLAELAEQNARLVSAVEVLRPTAACGCAAALVLAVAWLALR